MALTQIYLIVVAIFFIVFSVAGVIAIVYDKRAAINGKRRIRERSLFALAIAGGSFAMYIAMLLVHHKTRKKSFLIGIPVIFIAQCVLVVVILLCL